MPRPKFKPTEEQRKLVKTLSAIDLRQDHICTMVGLRSPKTLRKCFSRELSQGLAEATAMVARTAYEMAMSGDYTPMMLFWLKCHAPCNETSDTQQEETVTYKTPRLIFEKPKAKREELDAAA
ncbi:MAG: hypothetical protein ACJ74Z_01395 [Bryobacteraceae bacterium]